MSSVEWNKKEELVTEQAIKLLKVTPPIILVLVFIQMYADCCCRDNKQPRESPGCSCDTYSVVNMDLLTPTHSSSYRLREIECFLLNLSIFYSYFSNTAQC